MFVQSSSVVERVTGLTDLIFCSHMQNVQVYVPFCVSHATSIRILQSLREKNATLGAALVVRCAVTQSCTRRTLIYSVSSCRTFARTLLCEAWICRRTSSPPCSASPDTRFYSSRSSTTQSEEKTTRSSSESWSWPFFARQIADGQSCLVAEPPFRKSRPSSTTSTSRFGRERTTTDLLLFRKSSGWAPDACESVQNNFRGTEFLTACAFFLLAI